MEEKKKVGKTRGRRGEGGREGERDRWIEEEEMGRAEEEEVKKRKEEERRREEDNYKVRYGNISAFLLFLDLSSSFSHFVAHFQ